MEATTDNSTPFQMVLRSNNFTVCSFAMSYDPFLIFLSSILLVVSMIGFFGNCLLFSVLHDAHLLHKNVRFLLASMTMATTIICLCFVARCIFNLAAMLNGLSWPAISARACSLAELPATVSAFALIFSIFTLGAERLYATWMRQTTEHLSRWLVLMVVAFWGLVALNAVLVILTTEADKSICYCHTLLCYRWPVIAGTMAFYFITEFTSICIYLAVYHWNRIRLTSFGINSATHSLSERFQIANTIRATESLLPNVVLHGLCWSVIHLAAYYPRTIYVRDGPTPSVIYLVIGITSSALIYSALHPFLTLWNSNNLQRALYRLLNRLLPRAGYLQRFRSETGSIAVKGFSDTSLIPSHHSYIDTDPQLVQSSSTRKMSILSSGYSEGLSVGINVKEPSSTGVVTEVESRVQNHFEGGKSRKSRRKKSLTSGEGVRTFKMTPEQHIQLLEKYWE